jgi:hypothetical protein
MQSPRQPMSASRRAASLTSQASPAAFDHREADRAARCWAGRQAKLRDFLFGADALVEKLLATSSAANVRAEMLRGLLDRR